MFYLGNSAGIATQSKEVKSYCYDQNETGLIFVT